MNQWGCDQSIVEISIPSLAISYKGESSLNFVTAFYNYYKNWSTSY